MKAISFVFVILLSQILGVGKMVPTEERASYIWVQVISRPIPKKNELIPRSTKRNRHLAIVSDILPHGIWEMGPDSNNMIITTNTVKNLSEWPIHQITQKCIELGGNYIYSTLEEVNKQGLLDAIQLYEDSFAGKEKYQHNKYNENFAVSSIIHGAGGDISKEKQLKATIK